MSSRFKTYHNGRWLVDMGLKDLKTEILSNERLHMRLYLMKLQCNDIAREVEPGQFVHIKIPGQDEHILRRPFSVYSRDVEEGTIDILYQVVGVKTDLLSRIEAGVTMDMIGPIGHGWVLPEDAERILLVGAGVGAAPLFMLCEHALEKGIDVDVILGATSKDLLVCRDRYSAMCGVEPICSTDDGSYGRSGFCTVLAKEAIEGSLASDSRYDLIAVCGPEPVMRIVSGMATEAGIDCQVSLERYMACGIGACLSCVVETTRGKRRACVDGPIFDAREVLW